MTTVKIHHIIDDLAISEGLYRLVRRIEIAHASVSATLNLWTARAKERRHLAQMSDRLLNDVGLSRIDVAIETNKFFWQK